MNYVHFNHCRLAEALRMVRLDVNYLPSILSKSIANVGWEPRRSNQFISRNISIKDDLDLWVIEEILQKNIFNISLDYDYDKLVGISLVSKSKP